MSKNSINDIVPFPPAENMVHILERKGFTCAGTCNLNYDSIGTCTMQYTRRLESHSSARISTLVFGFITVTDLHQALFQIRVQIKLSSFLCNHSRLLS